MAKPKTTTATVKANGETYTLFIGAAALTRMETAFEVPLSEMKDKLKAPKVSDIVTIFAAALIANHPQIAAPSASENILAGYMKAVGSMPANHKVISWEDQRDLAETILDAIGFAAAADLIGTAFNTSPHFASNDTDEAAAA